MFPFPQGGGGNFLIKVGTDVRRVQNLGQAKITMPRQKYQCPGKKVPENLTAGQVFINFRVPKFEIFSK